MEQQDTGTYVSATIDNINTCLKFMDNSIYKRLFGDEMNISAIHEYVNIAVKPSFTKTDVTCENLKDIRSFLKLATQLDLTGHCYFDIEFMSIRLCAYENEAIDDELPTTGKKLCFCFFDRVSGHKCSPKYSFDMGDGKGFGEETYPSTVQLKKAWLSRNETSTQIK